VAPGSLSFGLGNNATLDITAEIGSGNKIALDGTNDVLQLNVFRGGGAFVLLDNGLPSLVIENIDFGTVAPLPTVDAPISGFRIGDQIVANAATITDVSFA